MEATTPVSRNGAAKNGAATNGGSVDNGAASKAISNGALENGTSRVIVVHPSRIVREALARVLQAQGHSVIGTSRFCTEATEIYRAQAPDLVISGVAFPDGDVVDLAKSLRRTDPNVAILVVGEGGPEEFSVAVEAGASGYLGAETREAELAEAVEKVSKGALAMVGIENGSFRRPVIGQRRASRLSDVTPREREILALVCLGHSNREIADRLVISEHTVRTHIQNIRTKLNVRSKMEAALVALRAGISTEAIEPGGSAGNFREIAEYVG